MALGIQDILYQSFKYTALSMIRYKGPSLGWSTYTRYNFLTNQQTTSILKSGTTRVLDLELNSICNYNLNTLQFLTQINISLAVHS
jgi:hypothetical protein